MIEEKTIQLEKKLKETKEELDIQTWALEKTNESLKFLYKELDGKNKKLKELDELKSNFVANVSHEFKTPLALIKESISIILEEITGKINQEQRNVLEICKNSSERLIRLVTDLLDVSKIEAGKIQMKREEIDIASIVNEVLKSYEIELVKRNINLKISIPAKKFCVWGDKDRIAQVIMNLLSNAVKHTSAKGNILVKIKQRKIDIVFEISDDGIGIPKKDIEKIFNKFEKVTSNKKEGTGLGLPITKDIVELHKGSIKVESVYRKGTKFTVVLPKDLRKSRG
jgi:signal transduction histidine kinase